MDILFLSLCGLRRMIAYDQRNPYRRSIRLQGYDYSQPGAYFATICTQNRLCLFGHIGDGWMRLNDAGNMVSQIWEQLPKRFPSITLDAFVVMPNHIHGIIWIVGAQFIAPHTRLNKAFHIDQGVINHAPTLGKIIRAFKALSTRLIRKNNSTEFAWQRNYYESVIRNDHELN